MDGQACVGKRRCSATCGCYEVKGVFCVACSPLKRECRVGERKKNRGKKCTGEDAYARTGK